MTAAKNSGSILDAGTRIGLRALGKAGGLPVMRDNERMRAFVEKALYKGTQQGFKSAQTVAKRQFARKTGSGDAVRAETTRSPRLFDLTPTEDQAMIQGVARELADEVIRPAAAHADTERTVPAEVRDAAAQVGLTLIGVPGELGGIAEERSAVTNVLVLEELARGDMGIAVGLMAPAGVANCLALYGDATQQGTFLEAFTGDEAPTAAAVALMEPQPLYDPLAPRTTARREAGELVLDGTKAIVPGAADAELLIVSAMLDGAPRLVIVEPGAEGLSVADDPAMGLRAAATGRLVLDGVRVPEGNLLGTTEDHLDAVRRARLACAALAVGTAQAALDQLIPYVKERHAFGEPIGHRQAVAFTVADIGIELAGLRLLVWRAASRLDQGKDASAEIAKARQLAAIYGAQIGSNAVQLLGGHGFVKEFDNERWYRDLRGAGVLEGALIA
ncbi:acyl-CoA dehydrogenase family protein [Actinomycetota bacterium]